MVKVCAYTVSRNCTGEIMALQKETFHVRKKYVLNEQLLLEKKIQPMDVTKP